MKSIELPDQIPTQDSLPGIGFFGGQWIAGICGDEQT